jgi:autotransporter-associated beta strand protein
VAKALHKSTARAWRLLFPLLQILAAMNRSDLLLIVATSTSLILPGFAEADILSATATTSATVQAAGPRTGANGTNYLNVEAASNGSFASYGVIDFSVADFNLTFPVTAISSLSLSLTESNSSFTTANSALKFYLTDDTTTSIANDGSSPLVFDTSNTPEGLGSQLTTTYLLGSGNFSSNSGSAGTGTVDSYSLSLSGNAETYFLSQLNTSGTTLRLIITTTDATGASTWFGGTTSTPSNRPTLSFDATLDQPTLTWVGGSGTWNATGGTDWSGSSWDSTKTALFATGSGTVTLGTALTTTGLKFDVDGYTIDGTGTSPLTLSSDAGGNGISVTNAADTATISAVIAGTSGLSKSGAGTLALTGANTFTGDVTIGGGTLVISTDGNLGATTNGIALNSGTLKSTAAVTFADTRFLSGSGSLDGTGGLLDFTGAVDAGALAITGGTVQFSGLSAAFTTASLAAGSQLTISAPLTSTGRTTFTGDGTVALNGDNSSNAGGFTINRGSGSVGPTVVLGSSTALGANTTYLNAGELKASGTFTGGSAILTTVSLGGSTTFDGGDMEFGGGFGFYGSSAKRITVLNNTIISSSITSTGTTNVGDALIKAGAGQLTLTAINNTAGFYTGGTQVLSGTLEVANTGTLGLGDVLVAAEDAIATVLRLDSNTTISDLSNVFINNGAGTSQIDLNFDSSLFENVNSLTINGTPVTPGDYNASDLPAYLTGTGNLRVLSAVPEPSVWALLLLSGCGLAAARTRRSRKSVA